MTEKKRSFIRDNIIAILFISFTGVIYIYDMFTNGPWYDELYTYYYFISRGPVYAAIHWPVPNNHVGYSVISAFFDFLGNPYIGLRGVSVIAGIANLALIYSLSKKFMEKHFATAAMALYAGAFLVFRLAFQGRGYTLATTCLLLSITAVYRISIGDVRIRNYLLFAASLTLGLYIVPSSIYWVLPVCAAGGLYLLLKKRYPDLFRLIGFGVLAAACTFFLYLLIWLAVGANLVCKDASCAYYGLSQVKVILKAPILAAKTGMDYMLASPYIQSIDRGACIRTLPEYFMSVFNNYYEGAGIVLLILGIFVIILSIFIAVKKSKTGENSLLGLFIFCGMLMVPVMLMVQSVHPYLRVMSFFAVYMSVGIVYCIQFFTVGLEKNTNIEKSRIVFMAVVVLLSAVKMLSPYYQSPLADRENRIHEVLAKMDNPKEIDNIFYLDDFQKYVIKFYFDVTPNEVYTLEEAECVMAGPEFEDSTCEVPEWPILYGYSQEMPDYVKENMTPIATAGDYTIYHRK